MKVGHIILYKARYYLPPTQEEVYVFARTPEFVSLCLSVCVQDYSKTCALI